MARDKINIIDKEEPKDKKRKLPTDFIALGPTTFCTEEDTSCIESLEGRGTDWYILNSFFNKSVFSNGN